MSGSYTGLRGRVAVSLFTVVSAVGAVLASGGVPPRIAGHDGGAPDSARGRVMRVQAVRVSDDDGGRRAAVEPGQVQRWVDYANEVYLPAGVRFEFDPAQGGFSELRSTLINSMMPRKGPDDARAEAARARAEAVKYPDRLVVFFRFGGTGHSPTGNGFSSRDAACVVMPGFECTRACDAQNIAAFAHEVGHFLGLDHTFADAHRSSTVVEAEAKLRTFEGDVSKFDGDGLSDTAPDPGIDELGCTGQMSVKLNGVDVPLPRGNIMSYLGSGHHSITPQQAARVSWMAQWRTEHGMSGASNADVRGGSVIELEGLPATATHATVETQKMTDFGWFAWSGGEQMLCRAAQEDASVRVTFAVHKAGRYSVELCATLAPNFGEVRAQIDSERLSGKMDLYAPCVLASGPLRLGEVYLSKGSHQLTVGVVGKNAASGGSGFGLDCLILHEVTRK